MWQKRFIHNISIHKYIFQNKQDAVFRGSDCIDSDFNAL